MAKRKLQKNTKTPIRKDWVENHSIIRDAYIDILSKKKRPPTYKELAEKTGISKEAVYNHIQKLDFEQFTTKAKVLNDDVVAAIYRSAMRGSAASQKLWAQIVGGWREKTEVELSGKLSIVDLMKNENE